MGHNKINPPTETEGQEPETLRPLKNADKIKYLVTDADNNLWDWVGMHAKCMHQMAARLCVITGLSYDDIAESMRRVYMAAKTLDYSNLVESMDVIQSYASSEAETIMSPDVNMTRRARAIMQSHIVANLAMAAKKEYDKFRAESFQLYPGIKEVFEQITKNRIRIVILTDAPHHKTIQRLKRFDLEQFVSKMFGQKQAPLRFGGEGDEVSFGPDLEYLKPYFEAIKLVMPHLTDYSDRALVTSGALRVPFEVVTLNESERKPNVDLARRLAISKEETSEEVAVWGDNPKSDGGVATGINVNTEQKAHTSEAAAYVYSEYGQTTDHTIADLLTRFGSTQEVNRNLSQGDAVLERLMGLQDRFVREKIQKTRTQIAKIGHPIQLCDLLGIPRP